MKTIINKITVLSLVALLAITVSCETEFVNPNAPTDAQVLSTKDGLFALSVGIKQLYSTNGLRFIIETPAITAREGGITTTFQNMIELEDGGRDLPNFNTNVEGLWATMLRIISMCDNVLDNVDNVELSTQSRASLSAYVRFFKALSIGALAQNYEQVIISTQSDNNASFVTRQQAFLEAINLLQTANTDLSGAGIPSDEFLDAVLPNRSIDLANAVDAYTARFALLAGDYTLAVNAAQRVDLSSTSVFNYDTQNANPVWSRVFQNNSPNFRPRDNFGLPASFTVDAADGRLAFYLTSSADVNQNSLAIEDLSAPFFQSDVSSIPVYLPGEMSLIIAEALVRQPTQNLAGAVAAINEVRTKTNDVYGLNAALTPYAGAMTQQDILNEIYLNRRIELFLTGLSLEDSRRFGRPQPSGNSMQYQEERNRNFYPYPQRERSNNANTPQDPGI